MSHPKKPKKINFRDILMEALIFAGLMVGVFGLEYLSGADFGRWGIYPRRIYGIPGIVLSPFIHGSLNHLWSNLVPMVALYSGLRLVYTKISPAVLGWSILLTGTLVWMFARSSYHIGASGLIYALASFLFFSGVFRKERGALALGLAVALLYGGLIWGVLPSRPGVSWESHLYGFLTGLALAWIFRRKGPRLDRAIKDLDEGVPETGIWDYRKHFPPPEE